MENELIAANKDFHIHLEVSHWAGPEIHCQQNLFVTAVTYIIYWINPRPVQSASHFGNQFLRCIL